MQYRHRIHCPQFVGVSMALMSAPVPIKGGRFIWGCKKPQRYAGGFEVYHFRQLLGVEDGKLQEFKHLNDRAIKPAVLEVNGLADYGCKIEPILEGRKVVRIRLSWWRKSTEELQAAYQELNRVKVGRRARITGTVELAA